MEVLIVGGTGKLGSATARALRERGDSVRVASRSSQEYRVDVTTGEGLSKAVAGVDVVVEATEGPPNARKASAVLVEGTRRLLAAGAEAGVRHHICVSIVGIDDVPLAYYGVKREQERAVQTGHVPWTIVRATQFHEFIGMLLSWRPSRLAGASRYQPVAIDEVAEAIADVAHGEPRRARVNVAGPEVHTLRELARLRGERRLPLALPMPGKLARRLREGALTHAAPDVRTTVTHEQWISEKTATS